MAYTTQAAVEGRVPPRILLDALDDDDDGQIDSGLMDRIIANASADVDLFIGNRVATPMTSPTSGVCAAALWFVIRDIYARRRDELPKEFADAIAAVTKWLMQVRDGEQTIDSTLGGLVAAAGTNPRVAGRVPSGSQTTY